MRVLASRVADVELADRDRLPQSSMSRTNSRVRALPALNDDVGAGDSSALKVSFGRMSVALRSSTGAALGSAFSSFAGLPNRSLSSSSFVTNPRDPNAGSAQNAAPTVAASRPAMAADEWAVLLRKVKPASHRTGKRSQV